ncbi:MAG: hypothetical protein ACYDCX_06670 [Acidithiobacillus sp.]
MKTENFPHIASAPQHGSQDRPKGPAYQPLRTSRHHIRHEVHLSYATNWRIKHLAKAWGVSYSEAVNRLVLEAYGKYEDSLPDVSRLLL